MSNYFFSANKNTAPCGLAFFFVAIFFVAGAPALVVASSAETKHAAEDDGHEGEAEGHEEAGEEAGGSVRISDAILQQFDVRMTQAGSFVVGPVHELFGEVVADPNRVQHVTPRYPGVVRKVFKHVGDFVRIGDRLALIENNESLTTYALKAAINGVITQEHVPLGESLEDGHEAFVIADTRRVRIDLQVFPEDLNQIKVGQKVTIVESDVIPALTGTLSYVSPVLDHATRTGTARLVVANPTGSIRPGLFVSARVSAAGRKVDVAVPNEALLRDADESIVIVQNDDGSFVRREVVAGAKGGLYTQILRGLEAGEKVVAKGGFLVKSELAKGAMGAGHGH